MKKLILSTGVAVLAGCMVTTVSKDYSVGEVENGEKLSYKQVDNLDDIESYDKSAIPVVVKAEKKEEQLYSPAGIHGLLWLCTLGIVPAWQDDAETYTISVSTPLGEKSGVCTVKKRQYVGWVPYMLPFASPEEDMQCEEELLSRIVSQYKKEWTAENVESMNAAKSERMKALRAKADALLAAKDYSEVMKICKAARSKSFESEYMPKARAVLKQEVDVAMQNKNYQRVIDMLKNEMRGSEFDATRSSAIVNLIVDNANERTIDSLLKEYAGELSLSQLTEIERKSADNAVKAKLVGFRESIIESSDKRIVAEIKQFVGSKGGANNRGAYRPYEISKRDAQYLAGLLAKIVNHNTRSNALKDIPHDISYGKDNMLRNCLIETTDSPAILVWMLDDHYFSDSRLKSKVERKLLSMLDKVTGEQLIEKILFACNQCGMRLVDQPKQKILLIKKLPETKMADVARKEIKDEPSKYNVGNDWDRRWDLVTAANVAAIMKDSEQKSKLVASILSRAYQIKKICVDEPMFSWNKDEQALIDRVVGMLPKLSEAEMGLVLSLAGDGGRLISDSISPEMAKRILVSGNVTTANIETELAKKISAAEIDVNLYHAVKSDDARKVLSVKMPDSVKAILKAEAEKVFAAICEKAKEAAKSTFELRGFYLGMSMDDAKAVYMHHFPDGDTEVSDDGFSLYVSGQRVPLCKIYKDTKVVYQLNFDKKLLKKWYKYDASTIRDWAKAYSREHGIDLKLDFINRSDEVYLPNAMLEAEPYHVSLHQEIWTYKNGMKNYRLTYFGEREFGGGNSVVKAAAHDKYSSVSAAEGTFRAAIEND